MTPGTICRNPVECSSNQLPVAFDYDRIRYDVPVRFTGTQNVPGGPGKTVRYWYEVIGNDCPRLHVNSDRPERFYTYAPLLPWER
jgi:hypothetical protein